MAPYKAGILILVVSLSSVNVFSLASFNQNQIDAFINKVHLYTFRMGRPVYYIFQIFGYS